MRKALCLRVNTILELAETIRGRGKVLRRGGSETGGDDGEPRRHRIPMRMRVADLLGHALSCEVASAL